MAHIVIIDDDEAICRTLDFHFKRQGFAVSYAHSAEEGMPIAVAPEVDAVILDIRLPGRDGLNLLCDIKRRRPTLPVIMITAFHDFDTTVAAMQGGAVDYVPKPIDLDELDAAVDRVLARDRLRSSDDLVLGAAEPERSQMIGLSFPMKEVFKRIALVAQSRVTVLVLGESGTGKELVARAIHQASAERSHPFVAINCAALVETLLESEMFGHERGAFTGAIHTHRGKVEQAGEGTLFLDEIAELSPCLQGKLLRVLEEREYTPVGGTQTRKSKARFIAATNVNLRDRVVEGTFREDLYYRLNVASVDLPPLRARRGDLRPLVEYLLRKINRDLRRNIRRVSADVIDCLAAYDWPGNVRELDNVLMKAVVMERGDVLTVKALPCELCRPTAPSPRGGMEDASDGGLRSLRELERDHIEKVLASTGWHKGHTCEILGISRPRLERRIREFELRPAPRKDKGPPESVH
ncbi:MAG: sigma-54-dependent Fis family transcriptional regulator [Alphaproteobacteria bacterium]|nr:sigma-54-dependent Fis family transcriptional regulator [Alphaproteobacteria bacterium]